jgi:uncharacterized RDD family membrane protein YckC
MITRVSDPVALVLRRYAQFAIDRLLLAVPFVLLLFAGVLVAAALPRGDGRVAAVYGTATVVVLVLVAGNWFIEVWVPHRWFGGTPGMRWLGLRVVTEHGETPGLRAYMIRWLLGIVDGYFFGLVGALAIAFSKRHQRVGDMVARTLVVRRERSPQAVVQPTR